MSEFETDNMWRLHLSGDLMEALRDLLTMEIENSTGEAGKQSHCGDRASYHRALANLHGIFQAVEEAEEVD